MNCSVSLADCVTCMCVAAWKGVVQRMCGLRRRAGEFHPCPGRVACVRQQTVSGTGALRTAGEFIATFRGKDTPIYLPTPTWGNHAPVFEVRCRASQGGRCWAGSTGNSVVCKRHCCGS